MPKFPGKRGRGSPVTGTQTDPMKNYNLFLLETTDAVEAALRTLLESLSSLSVVGLDAEWKPTRTAGKPNKVAVLQIATGTDCYIIRMQQLETMPPALVELLASKNILKAGVSVINDANFLYRDYGMTTRGTVDLRAIMPISKMKLAGMKHKGLASFSQVVLGHTMEKDPEMCMSNWEEPLSPRQIKYAAEDAIISLLVFHKMIGSMSSLPKRIGDYTKDMDKEAYAQVLERKKRRKKHDPNAISILTVALNKPEGKGAGVHFEYMKQGWKVNDIIPEPGQPDLLPEDLLVAVGDDWIYDLEQAKQVRIVKAAFKHGVQLTIARGLSWPAPNKDGTSSGGLGKRQLSHLSEKLMIKGYKSGFRLQLQEYMSGPLTEPLIFPTNLNNYQRRLVHLICEELGLKHESKGIHRERCIHVWKPNQPKPLTLRVNNVTQYGPSTENLHQLGSASR